MRIKHRFGFNNNRTDIISFLRNRNIEFNNNDIVSTLEIFEDDIHYPHINELFEANSIHPVSEAVFSASEISEAKWLSVRSTWRNGYPLPKEDMRYVYSTYDTTDYCRDCGAGLVQNNSFILQKEPNWSTRNFLMLNWIQDELFMSKKADSALDEGNFTGFYAKDVLNKSGDSMQEIKQMFITDTLDGGLCTDSVSKTLHCQKCGRERYLLKVGPVNYDRRTFENVQYDVVKSAEQFGEITCSRMIFVTQRFYKFIVISKLDRGLLFEPVGLVG